MKIGKFRIIKEEVYQNLKRDGKFLRERELIIKDNDIQKEKEQLEKRYKSYFGKSYLHEEDGIIFTIEGIYYSNWGYPKFRFWTSAYNHPEWDWEVDIDDIVEGKYERTKHDASHAKDGGDE